ncbi:MAG: hypothetical protein P8049_09595 [Gemmatimonadota bacterium]
MTKLRFLTLALGFAAVMALVLISVRGDPTGDVDTRRIWAAPALADEYEAVQEFNCPGSVDSLDFAVPIGSIHVTVRPGSWLRRIKIPAVPGSRADSVFTDTLNQERHRAPLLRPDSTGWRVELPLSGGVGANPSQYQFEGMVSLPRCTSDEGFLRRIHVDGPERGPDRLGPENAGRPEITVVGIYDRLLSAPAILDQAASCMKCGRIQVCGTDPSC